MDNGFHRIDYGAGDGAGQDHAHDPAVAVFGARRAFAANDNRVPLPLRLRRVAFLLLAGGAALWLFWTGLR